MTTLDQQLLQAKQERVEIIQRIEAQTESIDQLVKRIEAHLNQYTAS